MIINNYISENEFKNKIPDLISSIRQKGIINEIVPLDYLKNMNIDPNIDTLLTEKHYVNFGLVNSRMFELIEKIKYFLD